MMVNEQAKQLHVVTVHAGTGDPSSTQLLTNRVTQGLEKLANERGVALRFSVIGLRELSNEIATAIVSRFVGPNLADAIETLGSADGIVAATPIYNAGPSGLFTSFFNVLDTDLLIAKPVLLAATAESPRHGLVVDDHMRSLFAYLRSLVVPTSLFATPDDWSDPALNKRIDRVGLELLLLMQSEFATLVKESSWKSYQHKFGSANGTEFDVDFDSDLMRLAKGGSYQDNEQN